jgi:septum formation protein
LQELGLDFRVVAASVAEVPGDEETPEDFVQRAACDKAAAVAADNDDAWVLGADTVVVLDNRILGKPGDGTEALAMLQALAGREHHVHTGFCLMHAEKSRQVSRVVTTTVRFFSFSREIAAAYVSTGEPLDKAGAYGIQGCGGFLVERISGSYSNVVGLPLVEVIRELLHFGVVKPRQA